ncbi:MAG: succinylglutamate desuccinylase/aspartoacylase family protein [Candidatus Saccharibacteria bacterium]|nr:succinylglutamate desuccinylase/aspartoacylase family protein [Candidatus Saccharibacteria bacterium]
MITSDIIEIKGTLPGPTVAIFAGVHGNEMAGVLALEEMLPNVNITKGTIFIAFANPPAIEAGVRMVNKNLNRCFYKGNSGTSPEDIRARELMAILDQCDALLDLHMFYDDDGEPFVICEDNALEIAKTFDIGIISTNWTEVEPGATDGYMYQNRKIGICIECGPISKAEEHKDVALKTIKQFLQYFGMIDVAVNPSTEPKRVIKAESVVYKSDETFKLKPGFKNFQKLQDGTVIATSNTKNHIAKKGHCIIFPHYNAHVGEEACILGTEVAL